jgi:hypothetical protein
MLSTSCPPLYSFTARIVKDSFEREVGDNPQPLVGEPPAQTESLGGMGYRLWANHGVAQAAKAASSIRKLSFALPARLAGNSYLSQVL